MYGFELVVDYMNVKNGEYNVINFILMLQRKALVCLNKLKVWL